MKHSLSIKFYLHLKKGNGDLYPIYLRLIYNRQKAEISTDYKVTPKDWDENAQRVKKNTIINQRLTNTEAKIYKALSDLEEKGQEFSVNDIKRLLTGEDRKSHTLREFGVKFIERLMKADEIETSTINKYDRTLDYIQDFIQEYTGKSDISLSRIDYTFLKELDLHLLNKKNKKEERILERNTINKHHSRFRTLLHAAIKENHLQKNPYDSFILKNTNSNRSFLTQEELDKINEHDLGNNTSLFRVRDIFMFSVYTGLRFEDAQTLKMSQVKKDGTKNYIEVTQEKTGEKIQIPLLKPAIEIIEKYNNSEREITGHVLPVISNQKVNTYLKVIADLTGLDKKLTHHVARHTCATTVLLNNGVPLEAVSKWLGHNNLRTTQIYAKITNDYLMKLGQKLDKKV